MESVKRDLNNDLPSDTLLLAYVSLQGVYVSPALTLHVHMHFKRAYNRETLFANGSITEKVQARGDLPIRVDLRKYIFVCVVCISMLVNMNV